MRQRLNLFFLLIGCLLTLSACGQPASVGIPTPDPATAVAAQAIMTANAIPATTSPLPVPTDISVPPPEPLPTATEPPPPPPPTEAPTPEPPPPTPAPTRAPAVSGNVACNQQVVHIVKPGENLFRIALRYRTTIYAIARRNGITNTRVIRVGQRLRIVTCARGKSSTTPARRGGTYIVKKGDNMFRIALRYGTTVHHIMAANNSYSTLIVPGQVLVIP